MEPTDRTAFLAGLSKVLTLPSRASAPIDAAALDATWWGELLDFPWITAPVWERAVSEAVRTCDFRPAFSEMLGICEVATATLEQEAWVRQAPPLPPPTTEIAGATPEERERWAREDAFIRGHLPGVLRRRQEGAYLDDWGPHPTKPGVWIRTAPADMEGIRTAQASEDAMATVPEMTVEQRRARDRRTEVAKQRAREALEAFAKRRKEEAR